MLRIGEFSKLAKTTVKTLRFYEEEGLLLPKKTDEWTGYRYYESEQLSDLQRILTLRKVGMPIAGIREMLSAENPTEILQRQEQLLLKESAETAAKLSLLKKLLYRKEENIMKYEATIKDLPSCTVYYKQGVLKDFSEMVPFILGSADECLAANPDIKCLENDYCYVSYLDAEFKPENMRVEYAQAVEKAGKETENIKFKKLKSEKAVTVMHKGAYALIPDAYAFALNFAKEQGFEIAGLPREHYIDGIWNKENEADWLTEIEIPIADFKDEVENRWGGSEAYSQSKNKSSARDAGKELESVKAAEEIFEAFAAARSLSPESEEAKDLVRRWQEHITKYHYDCSKEVLACLGQMYVADERFKENLDSHGAGTAEFMAKAIEVYCG